ncbi:hypothetical protein Hamer_G021052 [Homarus americanus]|uniref:Uncharacterized protein n=1 Tax=Homarus americanus TaxID=6706 RepID=A0A8J5JM16_HOMAM|nr:hypothetical protein Hamer_G021052 [Homarus americanus]
MQIPGWWRCWECGGGSVLVEVLGDGGGVRECGGGVRCWCWGDGERSGDGGGGGGVSGGGVSSDEVGVKGRVLVESVGLTGVLVGVVVNGDGDSGGTR